MLHSPCKQLCILQASSLQRFSANRFLSSSMHAEESGRSFCTDFSYDVIDGKFTSAFFYSQSATTALGAEIWWAVARASPLHSAFPRTSPP
jgi:hypothetical protein